MKITKHIPYPIWHPYTAQHADDSQPPRIVRAKGALLYDENGRAILDAISSWWVTLHGHAEPHIARAIAKQARLLEQVIFSNFTHTPALDLSRKLLDLLPAPLSKVFFSDNGSTAVEVAIKMALQFWWNKGIARKRILAFRHAYHGDTFGAMSASDRGIFTKPFYPFLFDVEFIEAPTHKDYQLHTEHPLHEYAAIIYEPLLQAAGGMIMHEKSALKHLLSQLRTAGVPLIADEVMTAWGRTGKIFASDEIGIVPDIICLSKGITGGFLPLGVTVCTAAIHKAFIEDKKSIKTFFHGHSFTANPIACAAANASIDLLMQARTQNQIQYISEAHKNFIKEIKNEPNVSQARSLGTVLAFEIITPPKNYDKGSGDNKNKNKNENKNENKSINENKNKNENISINENFLKYHAKLSSSKQKIITPTQKKNNTTRETKTPTTSDYTHTIGREVQRFFMKKDIFVRPLGNTFYLMPPFCIRKRELDRIYKHIKEMLKKQT